MTVVVVVVAIDFAIVVDVDWAHKTPRKLKLIELQSEVTNAEVVPNTRADRQDSHPLWESGATLGPSATALVHLEVTLVLHLHALSKNICVYLCANSRACVSPSVYVCVCVCVCTTYAACYNFICSHFLRLPCPIRDSRQL